MSWIEDPGSPDFEGLDLTNLQVDQAYVRVHSDRWKLWLYTLSEECHKCSYARRVVLYRAENVLQYSSLHAESWRLYDNDGTDSVTVNNTGHLCEVTAEFGEFGVYDLTVGGAAKDSVTCILSTAKQPVNIYLPLLLLALVFGGVLCVWLAVRLTLRQLRRRAMMSSFVATSRRRPHGATPTKTAPDPETGGDLEASSPGKTRRLRSLDTFRGIALVLMVFVNYGAGSYWLLKHVVWDGLHLADLLNPWFMWIMGVCIPISIRSQLKKNIPRLRIFARVLKRSCILFVVGISLYTIHTGARLETIRLFGVLQRFAVAYLAVATLSILFTRRAYDTPQTRARAAMHDVTVLLPQWGVVGVLVAVHTIIIFNVKVPGCPTGYLGPGGLHDQASHRECVGGATGYLDTLILGRSHLFHGASTWLVYQSGPFESQGVIGCLPAIAQVFLGVQAGTTLVTHACATARLRRWLAWGVACGAGGAILSLGGREDAWIPVNKKLWSMSFVLVTSSLAFFLLCACYVLVDVRKWWSGAPFFYAGMNSTIVYVGHTYCSHSFPWHWALGAMNTHTVLLLENLWGTAFWVLACYWLYRVKFFLTI